MKPIAVICSDYFPNSESNFFSEISRLKRYEPFVFIENQKNIDTFPYKNLVVSPNHQKLEHMLSRNCFELIYAQFSSSINKMVDLKHKYKIPLITSFHGSVSPGLATIKKKKLLQLFSLGDFFTVPSLSMKAELIKHGCPKDKITVLYRGIELHQFPYKERSFPTKGPVNIIYVGKLVKRNGADLLIRAFRQVHQAFPNTRLTIIGNGEMKDSLVQLSKVYRLENHIEFKGSLKRREVAAQLEQSHIFCLPSMRESKDNLDGIPTALKEAMASGLPVVSTFHSAIPEIIEESKTGHLVAENDVDAIAIKLIHLISHPETWKQLGKEARAKIETDLNLHIQTEKFEKLIDQVISIQTQKKLQQPFFSVIIPTYNREQFIRRAINSVLNQTCQDFEIIVVDDGSKDQTKKVVSTFGAQVRYVYQENQGPSIARNTGIRLARGQYIAFLDSDDQFLPNKLYMNKKFLEANKNSYFLYSWYHEIKKGRKNRLVNNLKEYKDQNKFQMSLYKRKFTIRTSTVVVHKSCFDNIGLFNPKYRYSQDWDMWLRLSGQYKGFCQKYPLALYRRHPRPKIPARKRHMEIRKNAIKLFALEGEKKA